MRHPTRIRRAGLKIAAPVAALAVLGGVAYAATDTAFIDSQGNINACLPPKGGQVHVWLPGHGCSGGWQPLAFPATVRVGSAGATGPAGAPGPQGPPNPSATTVDGETITKLLLKQSIPASGTTTTTTTLYNADGLTILAACDSAGSASLQANGPASADAELTINGVDNGATVFGSQTNTLGPASSAALGPQSSGHTTFSYSNTSNQVVTGIIGYQKSPSFGAFNGCGFFGTVTSG